MNQPEPNTPKRHKRNTITNTTMAPINMKDLQATLAEIVAENNKELRKIIEEVVKNQSAKEKRKEAKAKRDPDMPRRPKNAYQLWCDDVRDEVKEEMGSELKEVSKELGRRWKEVDRDTKKEYKDKYEELKAEFDKEMEEYKNNKQ